MTNQKLNQIAEQLNKSNEYRVIRKYIKPEFYNDESISSNTKRIGVFLDVESTGLSYSNNKLIELGMVKFEYRPILNVALTRAKYKFFVIGNYKLWASKPNFQVLVNSESLTRISDDQIGIY